MEYASLAFLWLGFVCLLLWRRAVRRKTDFRPAKAGFIGCVLLFLICLFLWNYLFR